jgi:ribosomal protein S18 acetylase RimI-like enzyme
MTISKHKKFNQKTLRKHKAIGQLICTPIADEHIIEVQNYSEKIRESINHLIPQLSETAKPLSAEQLKKLIDSENIHLFLAEAEGNFIGMVTLVIVKIPTATRALIEDLVVDKSFLGQKIGKKLMAFAIDFAREHGASTVNLTCAPRREAANALYKKLGFKLRETNVYKLDI